MKTNVKHILICLIIIGFSSQKVKSQKPIFIGFQPAVTVEPFYEKGEFDINVVPLVLETPLSNRINIRLITLANYHFGAENQFSDLGAQVVLPIFFNKCEEKNTSSDGFYLGPILGFGRNLLNKHHTLTCGIEPGYLFAISEKFNLSLGMQLGGSYFMYSDDSNIWRQHFGIKVNLGYWLKN